MNFESLKACNDEGLCSIFGVFTESRVSVVTAFDYDFRRSAAVLL